MSDVKEMVKQLIETQVLINKLTQKKEILTEQLKAEDAFTGYKDDNVVIKKYVTRRTALKENIEKEDMMSQFPDAVKTSLDMKALASITEAHQYLEMTETDTLSVQIK